MAHRRPVSEEDRMEVGESGDGTTLEGVCLRVSIAATKHHYQKAEEERAFGVYTLTL